MAAVEVGLRCGSGRCCVASLEGEEIQGRVARFGAVVDFGSTGGGGLEIAVTIGKGLRS